MCVSAYKAINGGGPASRADSQLFYVSPPLLGILFFQLHFQTKDIWEDTFLRNLTFL